MFVASPPGEPDTVWLGGSMQYGELPLYAGADRSDGRAVVRSTDGGVNCDRHDRRRRRAAFEDQHPDQHGIAFDSGEPRDRVRRLRRRHDPHGAASSPTTSGQCAGRNLTRHRPDQLPGLALSRSRTRLIPMNAGLATLQFQSVSVDPNDPLGNVMGGTQDNGTEFYNGNQEGQMDSRPVTGDGGQSGIDAGDSDLRYHTYFGPQG